MTRRPWRAVVRREGRLLTFRATREDLDGLDLADLGLGLCITWLVGIGRWWDDPSAKLLLRLGLGSVVYVFALSLFLWLVIVPLGPRHRSLPKLLTFVSLTAPPGLLYAIPVERWFALETARSINFWFLAVVAAWRLALLAFYLARGAGFRWLRLAVAVLFPVGAIVFTLAVFNLERVVVDFMGGIRESELNPSNANTTAYGLILGLAFWSYFGFIPLLVAYVALVVARFAQREPASPGDAGTGAGLPPQRPASPAEFERPDSFGDQFKP